MNDIPKKIGRPPMIDREIQDKRIAELKILLASYQIKYESKVRSIRARHKRELAEELKQARKEYLMSQAEERDEWNRLKRTEVALKAYYRKKEEKK